MSRAVAFSVAAIAVIASDCAERRSSSADVPAVVRVGRIDLTIGTMEGGDPYLFTRIGGIAADERGRIFVADHGSDEIRAFDSGGSFLFAFGGSGAGPGELRGPCCPAFGPEDRLWVRETGNSRYTSFTIGEGGAAYHSSIRMQHSAPGMWAATSFDAEGRLVDVGTRPEDEVGALQIVRLHLEPGGEVALTEVIPAPPAELLGMTTVTRSRDGSLITFFLWQPYGARHLVAHGPGGFWAEAISSEFHIRWRDPDGELVLARPDRRGPRLRPGERSAAARRIEEDRRRLGLSPREIPYGVPDRKPPLGGLFFDRRGYLWIELNVAAGSDAEAEIYRPDGAIVARHTWPAEVRLSALAHVEGELALGIMQDELGVQRVARLRFEPVSQGAVSSGSITHSTTRK